MIIDELKFHWQYEGRSVICVVTAKDNTVLSANSAHTSLHDQFCRETGRRVSLARALKFASNHLFPGTFREAQQKEWRTKAWEVYRTGMTKRPRWRKPEDLQNLVNELRVAR